MQEIHRGDDKADVRGVLALGVGKLLVGDKAEGGDLSVTNSGIQSSGGSITMEARSIGVPPVPPAARTKVPLLIRRRTR